MKNKSLQSLLIVLLAITAMSVAAADKILVIVHANIYTAGEKGLIKDANMVIKNGKITALGKNIEVPMGVKFLDAKGGSITPGLFNSATHLGIEEVSAIKKTDDYKTTDTGITASLKVADAFNPRSVLIPQNRIHGLTYAIVMPESGSSLIAGQAALVDLSASDKSIINDSVAIVLNLGEAGQQLAGGSRAAAIRKFKTLLNDALDYAKNKAAYNQGKRRQYSASQDDLEAMLPVISGKKPLIVSIHRASDIEKFIEIAKAYKLKVILYGAEEGWLVADKIAAAQIPVILDPSRDLPSSYDALGSRLENAAILNQAGVKLLFSGIGRQNTHNAYLVRQAAGISVANGLPKQVAIAAISSNPMSVFSKNSRSNELKLGIQANFVLWQGDPLEVTSEALLVYINGKRIPMVSRSTRLRDRYYKRLKESKN